MPDAYTLLPIAFQWAGPMDNLSALDLDRVLPPLPGSVMPEWAMARLPAQPREPLPEQAQLAQRQGLWRWLTDTVRRTNGLVLMLDRLIPGVSYTPSVPRAVGSETLAVRAQWLESWQWLPTGFSVPVHAVDLVERWLSALDVRYAPLRRSWEDERVVAYNPMPPIAELLHPKNPLYDALRETGLNLGPSAFDLHTRTALEQIAAQGLVKMRTGLDFLPWQKTAAALSSLGYWKRLAITWSPGCLSGDTEVIVNRCGKGMRMALRDFVRLENNPRSNRSPAPSRIQSMTGEGYLRLNTCTGAYSSGVKRVYALQVADGRYIKATADHRFITPTGWKPLSALRVGDLVGMSTDPARPLPKKPKAYYPETCTMQHHPFHVHRDSARTRHLPRQDGSVNVHQDRHKADVVPTHRLVAEARLNAMSLATFIEKVRNGDVDGLKFLDPKIWHVHHKDRDTRNYFEGNLEVLTVQDHLREHGREDAWRHCAAFVSYVPIVEITDAGDEETFDLSMADPMNSFVADGFVVHNSGKTIGALLWCAARPRPLLVLTPSQGKSTWAREIATNAPGMDAFVWTAPSLRRKRDRTLDMWERDCRESGRLPVLIVGHETMTDAWQAGDIYRLVTAGGGPKPLGGVRGPEWIGAATLHSKEDASRWEEGVAVVLDEGHLFRNPKRWKGILNPDGTLRFEARQTAKGEMLQTFALMEIGRWATARCITTGTPIANQLDQYWVQLDWLDGCTGGFGTYYNFCGRYVGGSLNEHGGWEAPKLTQGQKPPNADELRRRLGWFAYEVPYSVSHGALPAKRRTTTYLPPTEQVQELGSWTNLLKEAAKLGPNALLEARLQRACSRKRKYVVARAVEYLQAGLKVLILTGRRKDCEVTGEQIAMALGYAVGDGIWWAHGGLAQEERDALRDQYMSWRPGEAGAVFDRGAPRGACLVGTYDSFGIVVNLQDTDVLLCPMLPHTWDRLWQGENRVARIGQQRPVLVEYIIAEGTDDEAVAGSFIGKLGAIGALTADEEIAGVGESLAGLTDSEGLLSSVWEKITKTAASDSSEEAVETDPETTLAAE